MTFQVTKDNSAQVKAEVKAASRRGLFTAGEHILAVSNKQVPLEDADLMRSGAVTDVGEDTVAMSYDTVYAVRQHEDMSLKHDPGRNAKYLSNACKSEASTAGKIVGAAIKRAVGT